MKEEKQIVRYVIGGTNYTVHRNFQTDQKISDVIQRELSRLTQQSLLTNNAKNDIILP